MRGSQVFMNTQCSHPVNDNQNYQQQKYSSADLRQVSSQFGTAEVGFGRHPKTYVVRWAYGLHAPSKLGRKRKRRCSG